MLCQVRTVTILERAICYNLILLDLIWYTTVNVTQKTQTFDVVEDIAKICGHLLNELKAIRQNCQISRSTIGIKLYYIR